MTDRVFTFTRIAAGGRVVIPAAVRERLGLQKGEKVVFITEGDHATLMSARTSRREAQALVAKYIKPGTKLSEELMAERRREAARE